MVEKIGKIEKLIIEGKATLVDGDGKPLKKVDSSGNPFSKVGNVVVSDLEDEVDDVVSYGADFDGYDYDDFESQIYDLPGSLKSFNDMGVKLQGRRK